jgi:amidohydrolase
MTVADPLPRDGVETPPSLIDLRRAIHRHPELRFTEHRTAALVEERLRGAGLAVRSGIAGTGLVASIDSGRPGPRLMLRADLDAMPVPDTKDVPYRSTVPGVSHACGHDVHTTVMVGVAERLAASPFPAGRVDVVFQPAEERPFGEPSGAVRMLEDGLFADGDPSAVIGLHCWPDLPAGSIGIDDRIAMGGKDAFRITITGRPSHAATPSRGRDAILGIAQLVTGLHQGFARSLDPGDLAILNVGTISGGASQSVVAGKAEVTGTIRTVEPVVRDRLRALVERVADGVAAGVDLAATVSWSDVMPPIVNAPSLVELAREVATEVLGSAETRRLVTPPMTADDFAFFSERAPGLYLKLGVCRGERCPALHDGAFDVDERAIGVGVAVIDALTRRLLAGAGATDARTGPEAHARA